MHLLLLSFLARLQGLRIQHKLVSYLQVFKPRLTDFGVQLEIDFDGFPMLYVWVTPRCLIIRIQGQRPRQYKKDEELDSLFEEFTDDLPRTHRYKHH